MNRGVMWDLILVVEGGKGDFEKIGRKKGLGD